MKFEKPKMTAIKSENRNNASGPDGCSVKWSGCCYKE